MASALVVAPAYCVKIVLIPDDARKGPILDQLENTGVSGPTKSREIRNGGKNMENETKGNGKTQKLSVDIFERKFKTQRK